MKDLQHYSNSPIKRLSSSWNWDASVPVVEETPRWQKAIFTLSFVATPTHTPMTVAKVSPLWISEPRQLIKKHQKFRRCNTEDSIIIQACFAHRNKLNKKWGQILRFHATWSVIRFLIVQCTRQSDSTIRMRSVDSGRAWHWTLFKEHTKSIPPPLLKSLKEKHSKPPRNENEEAPTHWYRSNNLMNAFTHLRH